MRSLLSRSISCVKTFLSFMPSLKRMELGAKSTNKGDLYPLRNFQVPTQALNVESFLDSHCKIHMFYLIVSVFVQ